MFILKRYKFITKDNRNFIGTLIAADTFKRLSFDNLIEITESALECANKECSVCREGFKVWDTINFRLADIKYIEYAEN